MFLEPEPPAIVVQPHVIVVRDHRAAGITRGVALCTASEGIREVAGPVFVVRMHARTISGLSIRASAQTRMDRKTPTCPPAVSRALRKSLLMPIPSAVCLPRRMHFLGDDAEW